MGSGPTVGTAVVIGVTVATQGSTNAGGALAGHKNVVPVVVKQFSPAEEGTVTVAGGELLSAPAIVHMDAAIPVSW
jgi:hypothetical protein